ncbi:hypothetical protein GEMRC1_002487 [Eukaryota sp. GEM-RC1]
MTAWRYMIKSQETWKHRRGSPSSIPECPDPKHKGKSLEYFCLTCVKVICVDCCVGGCSRHHQSIIKTTEMVQRVRSNLSKFDEEVSARLQTKESKARKEVLIASIESSIVYLEDCLSSTLSASGSYNERALNRVLESSFSPP